MSKSEKDKTEEKRKRRKNSTEDQRRRISKVLNIEKGKSSRREGEVETEGGYGGGRRKQETRRNKKHQEFIKGRRKELEKGLGRRR